MPHFQGHRVFSQMTGNVPSGLQSTLKAPFLFQDWARKCHWWEFLNKCIYYLQNSSSLSSLNITNQIKYLKIFPFQYFPIFQATISLIFIPAQSLLGLLISVKNKMSNYIESKTDYISLCFYYLNLIFFSHVFLKNCFISTHACCARLWGNSWGHLSKGGSE